MKLPLLGDFCFKDKKVLLRADFDVPLQGDKILNDTRIRECLPTIKYLLNDGAKEIILIGHLGRPEGRVVESLSLIPVENKLRELLGLQKISFLENLRFDPGEEKNDPVFAKKLAGLADFYVNEAFAVSHREHASIVGVPQFLPHAAGLHFASEVENLSKVLENPQRPLVFILGGAKPETKVAYLSDFSQIAENVLVGGLLVKNKQKINENIIYADLTENGLDIKQESINNFIEIIKKAGTIVWNGPMGKYEEKEQEKGTREVAVAIAENKGFKIVGGGDTIAVLTKFNLIDKMNYVSTGGGAMLEFLAKKTLPGIKALIV